MQHVHARQRQHRLARNPLKANATPQNAHGQSRLRVPRNQGQRHQKLEQNRHHRIPATARQTRTKSTRASH